MDASQVCCSFVGFGEGSHSRHDTPAQDRIARTVGRPVRFIKKIIVKPCAGKPQARFERGLMETGQR
jgi:hypothetical protein